ncbi:MAG: hypothetical protein IJ828_05435 [Treponema sp.]|nr:hypothetical protein [Treponema sp.]
MKAKRINKNGHEWNFIQTSGLFHLQLSSIEDVLQLDTLDPKLWVALACPVSGLEFSKETLELLDSDHNGRVRVPEILEAVAYIKKYFKKPEIIMTEGTGIPLEALSEEPFACGHSPLDSAKAVLNILEKKDASEIQLDDISINDKLFSPTVINGDGILPPEAVQDSFCADVVKDIVTCTGGKEDISKSLGIDRDQFNEFFSSLKAIHDWRSSSSENEKNILFLEDKTDAAAEAFRAISDKIDEFFLRCSLSSYDRTVADSLHKKEEESVTNAGTLSLEQLLPLPLAECSESGQLPLNDSINPAWKDKMIAFTDNAVKPLYGAAKTALTKDDWERLKDQFKPYLEWYASRPENCTNSLSFDRIKEILNSDAEHVLQERLTEEEKYPPIALATVELKKMLLYRRDFVKLLRNYVSFEDFYDPNKLAIFQCGTLYIDGRSCSLCFRVTDAAKHALMSPLSQCYLLYCDCVRNETGEKMQIAALLSAGSRDNIIIGRNGLFYDQQGKDWDATITKIVENPISIREAFWSPYKKLSRMIQERIAKTAADAENKVSSKMTTAVDNPKEAAANATTAVAGTKKTDVGTIAAISVAFTGIATVVGGLLQAFLGLGWWIPLGIIGIILAISFPSMFIAWSKLRQRNIAPILDASGWAVNGNVRINMPLGTKLTSLPIRPEGSKLDSYDPFYQKKFPIKRVIIGIVAAAVIILGLVLILRNPNGIKGVGKDIVSTTKNVFKKFSVKI